MAHDVIRPDFSQDDRSRDLERLLDRVSVQAGRTAPPLLDDPKATGAEAAEAKAAPAEAEAGAEEPIAAKMPGDGFAAPGAGPQETGIADPEALLAALDAEEADSGAPSDADADLLLAALAEESADADTLGLGSGGGLRAYSGGFDIASGATAYGTGAGHGSGFGFEGHGVADPALFVAGWQPDTATVTFGHASAEAGVGECGCPACGGQGLEVDGDGGLGAPAAATTLLGLANYLRVGYWTDTSRTSRYFNMTNSGTGANGETLYYNYNWSPGDADGVGTSSHRTMINDAFDFYGELLGITFVQTTSTGGDVDFFFQDNVYDSEGGQRAYNSPTLHSGNGGPIDYNVINVTPGWGNGSGTGGTYNGYIYQTFLHEIGHGLGLGHQGRYNAAPGVSITYGNDAQWENDSWALSMMSYFSQTANTSSSTTNYDYATLISPMMADLIALDDLYASMGNGIANAFGGNTIYGVGTNITTSVNYQMAQLASFADNNAFTIVDGGGIDTIDFSNYNVDQRVDVDEPNEGQTNGWVSSVGGLTGNMRIAVGTVIENVILGGGNDYIYGNEAANQLTGNAGNDTLYGSGGTDTLYGGDGVDRLYAGSGPFNYLYAGGTDGDTDYGYGGSDNDRFYAGSSAAGTGDFYSYGGSGNDYHFGGGDYDYMSGGEGNDYLSGYGGNDTLYGGDGIDTIYGGAGNDYINGGGGSETLYGGDGNDTFRLALGEGSDDHYGGAGIDSLQLLDATYGDLHANLGAGTYIFGIASSIENIYGGGGNDSFVGSAGDNVLSGNAGNDRLYGAAGNDDLYGGSGNDSLYGGTGSNYLYGGTGNDVMISGGSAVGDVSRYFAGGTVAGEVDRAYGGTGAAEYYYGGSAGLFHIYAFGGSDYVYGGAGRENLYGGSDYDYFYGRDGDDYAFGGDGNDRLYGVGDNDTLYGGNGNDTLYGGDGVDTLAGGAGNDYLDGGAGTETLYGGSGNDWLVLGYLDGADAFYGGTGVDTADLSALTQNFSVDLGAGTYSYGVMDGIENVRAGSGSNVLTGSAAANSLDGGAGNDTLAGLGGADVLQGGAGLDTADYSASAAGVTVRLWNGTGSGGDAQGDALSGIENLMGSGFDDTLLGSLGVANRIEGGTGDDYLNGLSGDDSLYGGIGTDNLEGGVGADVLDGGAGIDFASYTASASGVTVRLWNGTGTGGEAQGDTLTGIENVIGSTHDDALIGADGVNNVLIGISGDDYLAGLSGNDQFYGGLGGDTIDGGAGQDTVIYMNSAAGVTVRLWNGTASGGEATGDTLTSVENVYGSDHDDTIVGSNGTINALIGLGGNDYLAGLSGNDRLDGGAGDDTMEGGAGTDVFVFGSGYGQDRAADFTNGTDYVDLVNGLTFGDLTLSSVAGGVRAAISAAPTTWIDLIGVSLSDITSSDFL